MLQELLDENTRRSETLLAPFNPYTGENSVGERFLLTLPDYPLTTQWLPVTMQSAPLIKQLKNAGSLNAFIKQDNYLSAFPEEKARSIAVNILTRLRCRHDFPFWAATFVYIKDKDPGQPDCLFRLTYPQRRFVERLEAARLADKPIRIILLKARQWGGSTTSQLYMAWLQLIHRTGLNSLIISHVSPGSEKIRAMFKKMIDAYPVSMLHDIGQTYLPNEPKLIGEGNSRISQRIPQRNTIISIGTAESPDSCRGGDYALVHLSEVGLWKDTPGKKPEDIVRSACSGVLYRPYTMIVCESTANGVGNYFHSEYKAAADPDVKSQFEAMFVPWFDIELYRLPFASDQARTRFAQALIDNRHIDTPQSDRQESGAYLWWLWNQGATLEGIHWYIAERAKYNDHSQMASEYPTDDIEAFTNSGNRIFDIYQIERLRATCRPPRYTGEITGRENAGSNALLNLRFGALQNGALHVWSLPDTATRLPDTDNAPVYASTPDPYAETVENRYLVVVDIGGRGHKADWSVILVLDRVLMLEPDGHPSVVAQWRGHIDIDLLAWKAAQIAAFYDNALLVIESNTLETNDRTRIVDGDQSTFILNQIRDIYPNLYARPQSDDEIRQHAPRRYGFHTNTATKPKIISTLIQCIRDRLYTERDSRALDEYATFERRPNGSTGAILGAHDDILMTRAIALHICFNEMPMPRITPARYPSQQRPKTIPTEAFFN